MAQAGTHLFARQHHGSGGAQARGTREVRKALTLFTLLTSSPHLAPPQVLKALTLLMYLGTVKHLSQELSTTLQVFLRLSGSKEMETLQTEDSA